SLAYVQLVLGLIIGRVIVGHVFLKPYFAYKVYTVYDYLGIRFGPWTKGYVSALFLFMRTLASGTRLFIPSLVMVLAYRMFVAGVGAQWQARHHLSVMGVWDYIKLILASDYTLFSALIGATLGNMAAFGTDQDMVQRMLTAETHKKARRSLITAAFMDLPIAAAFVFIGILLFAFYQKDPTYQPAATADIFGSYILNVMPVGIRGLVLA